MLGSNSIHDTLRYSDDPEKAEQFITNCLKNRNYEIEMCREFLHKEKSETILMDYQYDPEGVLGISSSGMPLHYASKLISILQNEWTYDSAIFDLYEWTADLSSFRKRIDEQPDKQFIVLVDFHY